MQQLCDMMGNIITKQTLSKYENGVMLPKSDIVIALCDSLEINPDYLFSYKTSSPRNICYGKLQGLSKKEEMTIASIIENTIERTGEIEEICGIEHSFNSVLAEHQVKTLKREQTYAQKVTEELNNKLLQELIEENERLKEIVSKYEKLVEMGLLKIPDDMKL